MSRWLQDVLGTAPLFLTGMWITVQLALWSIAGAALLGGLVVAGRLSRFRVLRAVAAGYITLIRGTPLVTQLFVIYFGLAAVVRIEAFWAAAIGLAVHNASYVAEIYRAGIQAVPVGQVEAALSLGMRQRTAFRYVVAPQAVRSVLPALGNQTIIAVKDTSIASFITVTELFQVAQSVAAEQFRPLSFYLVVAAWYLVLVGLLGWVVRRLERRVAVPRA